jgi:hypothetical protein
MDEKSQESKRKPPKALLLLFAALLSPLACCGATYVLDILPPSILPPVADFTVNLFEGQVRVVNRTEETLYITPISTTTGNPEVIQQPSSIRQRDFPVKLGGSYVLTYDMADMPLAGIAVCRARDDCRLLAVDHLDEVYLDSYQDLPTLEQEWLMALQSSPERNMGVVIWPLMGLVPILLFVSWLYLTVKDRKKNAEVVSE